MNAPSDDIIKYISGVLITGVCGVLTGLIVSSRQKKGTENAAKTTSDGNKEIKILDGTLLLRTEEMKDRASFEDRIQKWSESQDSRISGLEEKIKRQDKDLDVERDLRRGLENKLHDSELLIKGLQAQINAFKELVVTLKDESRKNRTDYELTITEQQNRIAELTLERDRLLVQIRALEQGIIQ